MSKKTPSKMLVHQLSTVLPDDRPITAIAIVENIDKCPQNYTVVSRTYDQDADADLWRESGLFIKKKGRYICFSKTEGLSQSVVEDITVINEREAAPEGFSMISQTIDSTQKAWRKKQMCYKVRNKDLCSKAVTDIIICSRILHKGPNNIAPVGFSYAGTINGVGICYKTVDITNEIISSTQSYENIDLFQNAQNASNGTPLRKAPERPPRPPKSQNGIYPQLSPGNVKPSDENGSRDYEILSPTAKQPAIAKKPTRPAPRPPSSVMQTGPSVPIYATLPGSSDLDEVPFLLNPLLRTQSNHISLSIPTITIRTKKELDREYSYDFRAERET